VTETSGDAIPGQKWAPDAAIFGGADGKDPDFVHVARGAAMVEQMQSTNVSVYDIIRAASEYGNVFRVEPLSDPANSRAVWNVLVKTDEGDVRQLTYDLQQHHHRDRD
jgi:hypothetical protein